MFGLFKRKNKGCLYGKTYSEKVLFFRSLRNFAISDKMEHQQFFKEQYLDLLPHEKREFEEWLREDQEQMNLIKGMVDVIGVLLKIKKDI